MGTTIRQLFQAWARPKFSNSKESHLTHIVDAVAEHIKDGEEEETRLVGYDWMNFTEMYFYLQMIKIFSFI